jgi:DNA-binding YbaB/EbfC family protein
MFESIKGLGQIANIMRQLPKLREEMDKFQQRLGQLSAEGDAGAGMVKVRVNGRMEVQQCSISDEALGDREVLEQLVKAATNQAIEKVRRLVAEESKKMTASFGLPEGMNLPGLS